MHINNKISKTLWIHRQNLEVRNRQKITNEEWKGGYNLESKLVYMCIYVYW